MRAAKTILQTLDSELWFVHAQQRSALFRAVEALLAGGSLWLSALGRSLSGPTPKHAIKAIDRLLGNEALHAQRIELHRVLASLSLHNKREVVVLIDTTQIRAGKYALTASLAMEGRGLPLLSQVRSLKTLTKRANVSAFLRALKRVLPAGCKPIVVTDAGFESPRFDQITAMGWDYVGRVRHQTKFFDGQCWVSAQTLHRRALPWARNLGELEFPRHRPRARRLVLSA